MVLSSVYVLTTLAVAIKHASVRNLLSNLLPNIAGHESQKCIEGYEIPICMSPCKNNSLKRFRLFYDRGINLPQGYVGADGSDA